jgi:hypothetical protein
MVGSELVEPSNRTGFSHWLPDAVALREPMEPRAENWARAQFHYLPDGKPAGVRCVQLDAAGRCLIFGRPARPAVCASLAPSPAMCGDTTEHAMMYLTRLEKETAPT